MRQEGSMAGPTADERANVRSYLQAQAAKLSLQDLVRKVEGDSSQLAEAAEAAAAIDQARPPGAGDWSVNDVLSHLHGVCAGVNAGIVAAAEAGLQPDLQRDTLDETDVDRPAGEWVSAIQAERGAMFERVLRLRGDEHLDVTWEHPFFGPLNWREWLLFLRIHDIDHARQIGQIVETLAPASR
jgi:hypothetical protein